VRPPASEMWLLARSDESVAADAGQQNILTQYAERASASTGHDPVDPEITDVHCRGDGNTIDQHG